MNSNMETTVAPLMSDHDLLITMHEQLKSVQKEIKNLNEGTAAKLTDHETRIRSLEAFKDNFMGKYAIVAVVTMTIIGFVINYFSK